ncbi:MAG: hypothetical protein JNM88_19140 [Chitinophagaceae bacterium]|nr:hypothetical protein [Chitinophagaceae bacterium]
MKKIFISILFAFFGLSVLCQTTSGNTSSSNDSATSLLSNVKKSLSKQLYSPVAGTLQSNLSNINLTSEFGDNSATITTSFGIGASSTLSFYFKQPFEEKPKKVELFNKDGMSSGTSAEIAFQHTFWKTPDNPSFDDMFQRLKKAYIEKNKITDSAEMRGITTGDFDDETQAKFWGDKSSRLGIPVLLGFGYSVAKNDIDFITDSMSLAPVTENRTNHNLRFTIGAYARNMSVISFSIVKEIKYESGDPLTRIFSLGTSGLTYSKEVTVGNPVKKNLTRLQFDYRQSFYKKGELVFAVAPSLAFRTVEKSFVLEVPLYFLNLKDDEKKVKGLQGGVILGYTNKLKEKTSFKEGVAFSIFVGAPFDLLGFFRTK